MLLSCGASESLTMLDGVVCQYIWEFRWRAGQKHYSGTYWSATEGRHVSSTSRGWNSPGCCSQISTGRCTVAVHSRSCKRCAPRKERVSGRVELGEEEFSVVGFADVWWKSWAQSSGPSSIKNDSIAFVLEMTRRISTSLLPGQRAGTPTGLEP